MKQDFPHELMEIILVDDGSEDKTLEIMKSLASRTDIKTTIISDAWRGLGYARARVVDNASGEYILWLDSDMAIEKSFLTKQVALMEQCPCAGIGVGMISILPNTNLVLKLDLLISVLLYSAREWKKPWRLPGTGCSLYRVSAVKQAGGFNDEIVGIGEDIDLARRIRRAGWSIISGEGQFYESHELMSTWSDVWRRNVARGVSHRQLYFKAPGFISVLKMNPLTSFIVSINYAVKSYRLTKLKIAFLLPLYYTYRMTAWFYGFTTVFQCIPAKQFK